jgi:hypothetical protein
MRGEEEGIDVHQVFQHFDHDKNGQISNSEMAEGLRELGIVEFSQADLDELVAEMDVDSTGEVDYAEFLRFVRHRQSLAANKEAGKFCFGLVFGFWFLVFGFGLIWFGLVWFGLVWFGLALLCFALFCFALYSLLFTLCSLLFAPHFTLCFALLHFGW